MKKLRGILLISVVAIGLVFTACNNDDINVPVDGQKGNTHVSVTLKLASNDGRGFKAGLPNDYNDVGTWAGKDVINSLTIYLVDGASVNSKDFEVGKTATDGKAYMINSDGVLVPNNTDAAIRTTAGQKTVYVVVNPTAEIKAHLNKTSVAEFDKAYQQIALVAANSGTEKATVSTSASKLAKVVGGEDVIVMTNVAPATLDVKSSITAQETVGASVGNADLNRVSLQVERAVARVMTTTANKNYTIPTTNSGGATSLGDISDITWVLAQGENSLYVQHKVDWATPNYAWVPTSQDLYETEAGGKYDYSGLYENYKVAPEFGGTAIPELSAYVALNAAKDNQAAVLASLGLNANAVNGKFVLPTTHGYEAKGAFYKKGNTAYVLIRAKFTPAASAWGDSGVKATDGTFYVGSNGKIYTSAQAAYDDTNSTTITKYEGGKVLYYAWVNPDNVPEWYNSPVLRNNIYHIHIIGFKNLGTNWNPLFPEDPTTVDPKNPDPKPVPETVKDTEGNEKPTEEPVNPIDPQDPLTTPETWMSVDVSILPWLVHSYDVELGI